jgi:hypothetical protein
MQKQEIFIIVAGSKRILHAELASFKRRSGIEVVSYDLPARAPLTGYRDARIREARFAVVNLGRHEVDGGLTGDDAVESLTRAVPKLTIVTFSLDAPSARIEGVHAHVQMVSDPELLEESVEELTDTICALPPRERKVFTGRFL